MCGGIYLIEIGDKLYVGSTTNFKQREVQHRSSLKLGKHNNIKLQFAFDKFLDYEFTPLITAEDTDDLEYLEQEVFNWVKPELNIAPIKRLGVWKKGAKSEEIITITHKNGLTIQGNVYYIVNNTDLSYANISNLRLNKSVFQKGWTMLNLEEALKRVEKAKTLNVNNSLSRSQKRERNNKFDCSTYTFENILTHEVFKGVRLDFINKFNLDKAHVSKLIKGKQKSHNNWRLI